MRAGDRRAFGHQPIERGDVHVGGGAQVGLDLVGQLDLEGRPPAFHHLDREGIPRSGMQQLGQRARQDQPVRRDLDLPAAGVEHPAEGGIGRHPGHDLAPRPVTQAQSDRHRSKRLHGEDAGQARHLGERPRARVSTRVTVTSCRCTS